MTTPFPCAILRAYNICAGLAGFESSFPGDIAHGIDRADHLLLADHLIVQQTLKLRRDPRIDQGRVGLFENAEGAEARHQS
jgi:hypothetical protein